MGVEGRGEEWEGGGKREGKEMRGKTGGNEDSNGYGRGN